MKNKNKAKKQMKTRGLKKLSPAFAAKKQMGYQDGAQNVAKSIAKNLSNMKSEEATLTKLGHRISHKNSRAFGQTSQVR